MSTDRDTTAAIYVRISSDPEGERAGVVRQREDCERLAAQHGLTVVEVYEDNDTSAYSGKVRPEFERMISDAAAGEFTTVIVWALDRLLRQGRDLYRVHDELHPHAEVLSVKDGAVDLDSASGILHAQFGTGLAEFESRRKAERVTARAKQRAKDGKMTASRAPAGWRWKDGCPAGQDCQHVHRCQTPGLRPRQGSRAGLELDPTQAQIIADAYQAVADGRSLRSAFRQARAAGSTLQRVESLRHALLNPRNAGLVSHRGAVVAEAADGLRIVDRDLYERVVGILSDPSRRTSPGRSANTILGGGLLVCGKCGGPMAAGGLKSKKPCYICTRGRHLTRVRDRIDTPVLTLIGDVLGLLADDGMLSLPEPADTRAAGLRDQIAVIEARQDALAAEFATGGLDAPAYRLAAEKLTAMHSDVTARLTRRNHRPALAALAAGSEGVRAAWGRIRIDAEQGNVDALSAVLSELLASVTAEDDGTITLNWRDWIAGPLPTTVTPEDHRPDRDQRRAKVAELHAKGLNQSQIGEALGCYRKTVAKDLKALGLVA